MRTQEEKRSVTAGSHGFLRTERSYGSFFRAVPLPDGVEEEKVAAKFKDGVLEITVPVNGRNGGRRIKVES